MVTSDRESHDELNSSVRVKYSDQLKTKLYSSTGYTMMREEPMFQSEQLNKSISIPVRDVYVCRRLFLYYRP